jgi:hypothetical protein
LNGLFNGTLSTDGTAYTPTFLSPTLLLLWGDKTSTKGTSWILTPMFFTIFRSPVIHQIFTYERFATIGTAGNHVIAVTLSVIGCVLMHIILTNNWLVTIGTTGSNAIEVTHAMIRRSLMHIELGIVYRPMAASADEMLWMPHGPQSCKIVPTNRLSTSFADKLRCHLIL